MSWSDQGTNGVRALHGYGLVDGGDVVGITKRGGAMVRIPAWTVIGDNLILGAHPADAMPPNVDVIANVDSFRFYDVPDGVVYLHFTYRDTDAVPDATELDVVATFLNDLRAAGKTVFVHCRLGLNRSALLAGLMLIDEGFLAADAIRRENLAVLELDVELVRDLLAHVAVVALAQGRLLPVASSVRGRRPPASSTGGRRRPTRFREASRRCHRGPGSRRRRGRRPGSRRPS
jgi:Dual specificity phosphatase, catalytic domain